MMMMMMTTTAMVTMMTATTMTAMMMTAMMMMMMMIPLLGDSCFRTCHANDLARMLTLLLVCLLFFCLAASQRPRG